MEIILEKKLHDIESYDDGEKIEDSTAGQDSKFSGSVEVIYCVTNKYSTNDNKEYRKVYL